MKFSVKLRKIYVQPKKFSLANWDCENLNDSFKNSGTVSIGSLKTWYLIQKTFLVSCECPVRMWSANTSIRNLCALPKASKSLSLVCKLRCAKD